MAHTKNSITIKAPYDRVFDITNDIARWPDLFDEYKDAKILEKEAQQLFPQSYVAYDFMKLSVKLKK